MSKSDWDKYLERKTNNIGFISKLGAFREPTATEKAVALAKEIESWQLTKGTRPYKISNEYNISKGFGINLRQDNQLKLELISNAKNAYINTPMDKDGILKAQGIDITPYQNPPTMWQKFKAKNPNWLEELLFLVTPLALVLSFFILFILLRR